MAPHEQSYSAVSLCQPSFSSPVSRSSWMVGSPALPGAALAGYSRQLGDARPHARWPGAAGAAGMRLSFGSMTLIQKSCSMSQNHHREIWLGSTEDACPQDPAGEGLQIAARHGSSGAIGIRLPWSNVNTAWQPCIMNPGAQA